MPGVIIIAGPNGAGKTTFANEYLSTEERRFEFVNADEIVRELGLETGQAGADVRAGRIMLERIEQLVDAEADFVIETTLASLIYARKIPTWRKRGYRVSLAYLRLASVEESIGRVRKRVAAGGHGIPEEAIRRRFPKSAAYLENMYKPIVDEWYIWKSVEGTFVPIDAWDRRST